ncbi:MAG: glycosyltransferase family 4 protein [Rikenellaceae bacterium]
MRVLMFGWEFPPHIAGGLGTACYGLTKALAAAGVDVTFVVPRAYGDEDQSFVQISNASDVEAEYGALTVDDDFYKHLSFIHINSNLVPYLSPEEYEVLHEEHSKETVTRQLTDPWKERYTFSGKYGATLMEEVARYAVVAAEIAKKLEGQFDVIHAHDWLTYYAGIAAKRVSGKPLVVHMHATEFDRTGENVNTIVYNIERTGMSAADMVCAVSNMTRKTVIEKYGIPADKVTTVHNGVLFKNTDDQGETIERGVDDKIVTFLGRITYQKGPDYFVEAAAKVLAKVPNVRFVMAGSGDMLNHVIRRVAKLGISDRFHFTGFLKGNDVQKMFALSDIYIMPSVSEPFGISPLEAMRSNVPCIISKQSGVAEVLDYAVKVDYWDVDAMADAIYGLLTYPSASALFKEKGMEEVNTLKWDKAAGMLKDIYAALM